MAAMLFCLLAMLVFSIAAGLAERYVPDSVWDKLMHLLKFD